MTSLLLTLAMSAPAHGHDRHLPPPGPTFPPHTGYFQPPVAPLPHPGFGHRGGAVTLEEFAKCFKPTPGHHTVWIVHPKTCRPVEVCFDLPDCGCPKVRVNRRSIEFDYGRREVELQFRHNGTVDVKGR